MEKFRTVTYEVHNPKIKKSVRFAVLADLHGSIFGEENSALLKKIQNSLLRRSNSWIFSSNADSHRLRSAPLLQSQPKPDGTSPADVRKEWKARVKA